MLKLESISFSYEKKPVLKDFSLQLENGEILAVMGPSGCGKSTLLSIIAGLKRPTDGKVVSDFSKIAFVFQEARLFPWLTVKENLAAVLDAPKEAGEKIAEALAFVALSDAAELYPHELSGGMKSRVSLARALVCGGDLFLLDEPFSALDEALQRELCEKLRTHLKEIGASAILVTHQSSEAASLADRTVLLSPITPPPANG